MLYPLNVVFFMTSKWLKSSCWWGLSQFPKSKTIASKLLNILYSYSRTNMKNTCAFCAMLLCVYDQINKKMYVYIKHISLALCNFKH